MSSKKFYRSVGLAFGYRFIFEKLLCLVILLESGRIVEIVINLLLSNIVVNIFKGVFLDIIYFYKFKNFIRGFCCKENLEVSKNRKDICFFGKVFIIIVKVESGLLFLFRKIFSN